MKTDIDEKSIMAMTHAERQEWMIDALMAQLEAQTKTFGEIRRDLPWIAAVLLIGGFVAGVCFARIWWDI